MTKDEQLKRARKLKVGIGDSVTKAERGAPLDGAPKPHKMIPASGGLQVAADIYGTEGPLVILQHGGGQTRHAWKGAGQKLAEAGYLAVSLDARGHGDSDWAPDGDYSNDALVEDLVAVVDSFEQSPILVGASMGGGTSLTAVGEGRVNAAALVLVDTAPRIEAGGVRKIRDFMGQAPDGFSSLEEVADAIANYQPHRPRPRVLDGLRKNVRLDETGRLRWHWDPAFIQGKTSEISAREQRMQAAAECLASLQTPTLLVRGGLSDVLSEEGAQSFLATCPHSEYLSVTDAAHMVAGDRNDLFTNAVVDFLVRRVVG